MHMNLRVILEPSPDSGFTVFAPSLPGCVSEGDTREEALANIREAIELYLEAVEDDSALAEGIAVEEVELAL
jgi:predicted RNase H-like HicB family nuclease